MNDDVDNEAWAMESMALTPDQDAFELYGTPWGTIYRRWIMSLVDHFTSIRVLEQACVKLPAGENVSFSLLGMDHQKQTLPDWEIMENIICQLQPMESVSRETYIADLKSYIETYERKGAQPGTAARYRDTVVLPFQEQLKSDTVPRNSQPVAACFHCEAILIAVMAYLAGDSEHDLTSLFQVCSTFYPSLA